MITHMKPSDAIRCRLGVGKSCVARWAMVTDVTVSNYERGDYVGPRLRRRLQAVYRLMDSFTGALDVVCRQTSPGAPQALARPLAPGVGSSP